MDWKVEPCDFKEVRSFAQLAAEEGVEVNNPGDTHYFCVRDDFSILGFGGILIFKKVAHFKGDWTRPGYRSKGIGTELLKFRIQRCRELGITKITAICTNMSYPLYLRAGFVPGRKYKSTTLVTKLL